MSIKNYLSWLTIVMPIFVLGCSATGGAIGGLVPAPKLTKGELRNGVYTSQDKKFSVNSPFPINSSSYTYMQIQESYTDNESRLVFASSVNPAEVYRVDVLCNLPEQSRTQPAHTLAQAIRESYVAQFSAAYDSPLSTQQTDAALPNEFTFIQIIPERKSGLQKALGFTVQHSSYALKKDDCLANVWVSFPISEKSLPAGAQGRKKQFLDSFKWN